MRGTGSLSLKADAVDQPGSLVLLNNAERMKLASDPSMKDLLLSNMPNALPSPNADIQKHSVRSKTTIALLL